MSLTNQRGQSLIEAIVTSTTLFLAFFFMTAISYRGLVYFTARHCVNEMLFCLVSLTPEQDCQKKFTEQTKAFLVFKETSKIRVEKSPHFKRVIFEVSAPGTPDMKIEREIKLPLKNNLANRSRS
jgi:hypothetical protein